MRATARGQVWPATLRRRAKALLKAVDYPDADVSIVLTDDDEIAALNAEWRGKEGPTDVLSFAVMEAGLVLPPGMPAQLGDLVISVETAARQVSDGCLPRLWPALGAPTPPTWDLLDEVTFLLVHGVLHLVGYDHIEPADAERMFAREAELLPGLIRPRRAAKAPVEPR